MRFMKRPRSVSVKKLLRNFERLFDEVVHSRIVRITFRRGNDFALVPIALKESVALKRQPKSRRCVSKKSTKRW